MVGRPGHVDKDAPSHAERPAIVGAVPRSGSTSNQTRLVSTSGGSSAQAGRVGDGLGDHPGVAMVLGQPLDVMLQRVQGAAAASDAGLPHAAAEQLADAARRGRRSPRPGQRRADRRPQPLAEADRHAVEVLGPLGRRDAGGDDGVPQPGAVQVHDQAVAAGPRR